MTDTKKARSSSRKSSRVKASVKQKIITHLNKHKGRFLVKNLAKEFNANESHVRRCCRELANDGLIMRNDLGIAKEYFILDLHSPDPWNLEQSPDTPLPKTHALTLTVSYDLARQRRLGMGVGTIFRYNKMYYYRWGPSRYISWKYGRNGVLTIYLKNSKNPLDFEAYKHFLTFLEGHFKIPIWSRMDRWTIRQYGLNKDIFTLRTNEEITLSCFSNFFCRIYDKKLFDGTPVQRFEYHVGDPMNAHQFMLLFQNSVESYIQERGARQTNHEIRQQGINIKSLESAVEHLISELPGILANTIKQSLAPGQKTPLEEGPTIGDRDANPFM